MNNLQEIYMASTPTSFDSSNTADFHPRPTISSSAIMLIVANNHWKQSVFCLRIRSNIPKISSCCEEITNVRASTGYTASMTSASVVSIFAYGRHLRTASIVCQLLPLWMRRSSAATVVFLQIFSQWNKFAES